MDEFTQRRHILHVEIRQDYMMNKPNASFHVILDIEKDTVKTPDLDKLLHEIYRVRRQDDGTL